MKPYIIHSQGNNIAVVVVGHTRCGGIRAAYDEVHKYDEDEADKRRRVEFGENIEGKCMFVVLRIHLLIYSNVYSLERCPGNDYVREWIQPIVKLVPKDPAAQENIDEAIKELTKANVLSQIGNIKNSGLLPEGVNIRIYGLIYDLETGLLHEV